MDATERIAIQRAIISDEYRPHRLCKDVAGYLWEFISRPYPDGDKLMIKIRVPGDPTTIRSIHVFEIHPEGNGCYCEAARNVLGTPEFYFFDERNR